MLFWASSCSDSPWTRSSASRLLPPSITASTQQSLLKSREIWIGALGGGGVGRAAAAGWEATWTGGGAAIGGAWLTFPASLCRWSTNQANRANSTSRISPARASRKPQLQARGIDV